MHDLSILTDIQVEEHMYYEIKKNWEIYHAFSPFHQQWKKKRLSSLNEMLWSVSFVKIKHGLCRNVFY